MDCCCRQLFFKKFWLAVKRRRREGQNLKGQNAIKKLKNRMLMTPYFDENRYPIQVTFIFPSRELVRR